MIKTWETDLRAASSKTRRKKNNWVFNSALKLNKTQTVSNFRLHFTIDEHRKNVPHYTSNDLTRLVWMLCLLNWISLTPQLPLCCCCFSCCCSDAKRIVCFHIGPSIIVLSVLSVTHSACVVFCCVVLCCAWLCCVVLCCVVYTAYALRCAYTGIDVYRRFLLLSVIRIFCYFIESMNTLKFVWVCVFLSFYFRAYSL